MCLSAGYQFLKHTDSTLFAQDNNFSTKLINQSPDVDVSEAHTAIGSITYAPATLRGWRVRPELNFFAKYPLNGKRMMSGITLGGGMSVRF